MEGNRLTEKAALRKMEALLVEMDRAENPHDFVEKDIAFHAMVVDAAGSPALKKVWDSLRLVERRGCLWR